MKAALLKRGRASTPAEDVVEVEEDAEESEDSKRDMTEFLKRPAPASDLIEPDEDTAINYMAMKVEDTFSRLEKALTVQGAMVLRLAEQAARGAPPANVVVETAQQAPVTSVRVQVVRGRDGLISELVLNLERAAD